MISISELAQRNRFARHLVDVMDQQGSVPVMFLGDSLTAGSEESSGSASHSGLRTPMMALLIQLGVTIQCVGDITGTTLNDQYLFNTLGLGSTNGVDIKYQAQGGKNTLDLLGGTNLLTKLSTALSANQPRLILGAIGTNDSPTLTPRSVYDRLFQTVYDYGSGGCPMAILTPPDSNDVTKSYYNNDLGRSDTKFTMKASARAFSQDLPLVLADTQAILGMQTRYPQTASQLAANLNANGIFYDGTHLKQEGYAIMACGLFAAMLGASMDEMLDLIQSCGPFVARGWAYGADVASTTAVMVASGPRKNTLDMLTVYNTDASTTATVTIGRRRLSQDGTSTTADTAFHAFKVPAGATVGWVPPDPKSPPVAWYNEGWYVTTTTTCNVRAFGRQKVA